MARHSLHLRIFILWGQAPIVSYFTCDIYLNVGFVILNFTKTVFATFQDLFPDGLHFGKIFSKPFTVAFYPCDHEDLRRLTLCRSVLNKIAIFKI